MTDGIQAAADRHDTIVRQIAESFRNQIRSPILSSPRDVGLAFETVSFPSEDGTPLEGWFIPSPGSDRLVIANHPRWFNRAGLPGHLEPWKSKGESTGNDFAVDFVADYKILHDAGYNVLAYDLRNHGHSGVANGALVTSGIYESRDVIGALAYARLHAQLSGMAIGLLSRCLGCNSTFIAASRNPRAFDGVRCLVGVQPLSVRALMTRTLQAAGIDAARIEDLDRAIRLVTSFGIDDLSPVEAAKDFPIPAYLYQVRDDVMVLSSIVQQIFDNIPVKDKTLFWIEGTTRRYDGYTFFARQPRDILAWIEQRFTGAEA